MKVESSRLDQNQCGEDGLAPNWRMKGAPSAADGDNMRGKKLALAVIVLMLVAGQAINHYVPDVDYADQDQQAQTQLTDAPATDVK
jgi:hypothetical protein